MNIHEFIHMPHRFRWGGAGPWAPDAGRGDDCMTFAASWCFCALGTDPAASLRGTYRTRQGAEAIIADFGGHEQFMNRHLRAIGAKRVQQPQDGDVGLVEMLAGDDLQSAVITQVGAVRFGPMWASIAIKGVVIRRAEHVACWRLPL